MLTANSARSHSLSPFHQFLLTNTSPARVTKITSLILISDLASRKLQMQSIALLGRLKKSIAIFLTAVSRIMENVRKVEHHFFIAYHFFEKSSNIHFFKVLLRWHCSCISRNISRCKLTFSVSMTAHLVACLRPGRMPRN